MTVDIDNTKIMNDKRHLNAMSLIKAIKDPVIQDISDKNRYAVRSTKEGSYYEVIESKNIGWLCNCLDYVHVCTSNKDIYCKHIQTVQILKSQGKRFKKGVLNL